MHSDLEAFLFQKFLLGLLSCGCGFQFWFFGQLFTIYVTTIISVNDRVPRSNFLMLDFLHGSSHNVSLCWIFLCGHGTTNHRKLVLAKLPHYVSNYVSQPFFPKIWKLLRKRLIFSYEKTWIKDDLALIFWPFFPKIWIVRKLLRETFYEKPQMKESVPGSPNTMNDVKRFFNVPSHIRNLCPISSHISALSQLQTI